MSADSISPKTSICAEIARWHGLSPKSRGAKMAIFGIFGIWAKTVILDDFQEKPKLAVFRAPNRSNTTQKGVKPPPNTLETSLMNFCPRSENRKFFPFSGYWPRIFGPRKLKIPKIEISKSPSFSHFESFRAENFFRTLESPQRPACQF